MNYLAGYVPVTPAYFSTISKHHPQAQLIPQHPSSTLCGRLHSSSCSHGGADGGGDGGNGRDDIMSSGTSDVDGTHGGKKGSGKGSDGQWMCPKCGDPCSHLDTCACKLGYSECPLYNFRSKLTTFFI